MFAVLKINACACNHVAAKETQKISKTVVCFQTVDQRLRKSLEKNRCRKGICFERVCNMYMGPKCNRKIVVAGGENQRKKEKFYGYLKRKPPRSSGEAPYDWCVEVAASTSLSFHGTLRLDGSSRFGEEGSDPCCDPDEYRDCCKGRVSRCAD